MIIIHFLPFIGETAGLGWRIKGLVLIEGGPRVGFPAASSNKDNIWLTKFGHIDTTVLLYIYNIRNYM